ncbi:MAG: TonB-dependent receptor [Deltaproteobacteria bacterium]|nr:TonB-dependent receptor [Deltaproteobacteria bacterium]
MINKLNALVAVILLFVFFDFPIMAQDLTGELDTIVVTGSRTAEQLKSVSGSMTIISEEDIQKSGAKELGTLLAQKGFVITRNAAEMRVQIRGMADDQSAFEGQASRVLILLNGRRIGLNIANLTGLGNIDHIEIVRGPSAIQYGPSAMGGVINIITKRGQQDEFHVSLESGVGSFNYYKESVAISGGLSGFDFSGSMTYTSRGDYKVYGGRVWPKTAEPDNTNINVDVGYNFFDTHRVGINFLRSNVHSDFYSPGLGGGFERAYYDYTHGIPIPDNHYFDYLTSNVGFTYEGATPSEIFDWSLGYSEGSFKRIYQWAITTIKNREFQGHIGFNSTYFDIDLGFDSVRYRINDVDNTNIESNYISSDFGFYATSKLKLLDDTLFFTIGARQDRYKLQRLEGNNTETAIQRHFSPSFGISYVPLPWLKFRTNYSKGFKIPTGEQMNGGTWYDPNPNLRPEQSKTWEIGADVNWNYLNASLTYFNTVWIDKILGLPSDVQNSYNYKFFNIKKSKIAGIEFSIDADIGQILNAEFVLQPRFGVTYYVKRQNDDPDTYIAMLDGTLSDQLPYIPKYSISYGVTFVYPKYDLTVDLNGVYIGETLTSDNRPSTGATGAGIHYTYGTTSVDLAIEKGLVDFGEVGDRGKLSLRLEMNNIFDNKNETYLDFPGPGRNFYVALKYTL